jgi:hypothetical protein
MKAKIAETGLKLMPTFIFSNSKYDVLSINKGSYSEIKAFFTA